MSIGEVLDAGFRLYRLTLVRCLVLALLSVIVGQIPSAYDLAQGTLTLPLDEKSVTWWLLAAGSTALNIGVSVALLAATAQQGSHWRSLDRARLYRLLESVGHWSMLDVFVVVSLVGMVQFGAFASVQPAIGLLAFGGVVIATMLASSSFDARLLWPQAPPRPAWLARWRKRARAQQVPIHE